MKILEKIGATSWLIAFMVIKAWENHPVIMIATLVTVLVGSLYLIF